MRKVKCKSVNLLEKLSLWDETMQIYRDSFPEWEREDELTLLKNLKSGQYKIFVSLCDAEVIGFYILDINKQLHYTLFSFLAVKESYRDEGIGSKLCLESIEFFQKNDAIKYLLIEAEPRQAQLYKKLGFKSLEIDYRVPKFDSDESVTMELLCMSKAKKLPKNNLKKIVEDIFTRGYALSKSDIRVIKQLERI